MQVIKNKRQLTETTLSHLMAHCEANYLLLVYILPNGHWKDLHLKTTFGQNVRIQYIEESTYTMTIAMWFDSVNSQLINNSKKWVIRLYHDAEVAEMLADDKGHQLDSRYHYPNQKMYSPDEKFRANEHLNECLLNCYQNLAKRKTNHVLENSGNSYKGKKA